MTNHLQTNPTKLTFIHPSPVRIIDHSAAIHLAQMVATVSIDIDAQNIIDNVSHLLQSATDDLSRLTSTAQIVLNSTAIALQTQLDTIGDRVRQISIGIQTTTDGLPQPWLVIMITISFLILIIAMIILVLLCARRELKIHPLCSRMSSRHGRYRSTTV